MKIIKSFLLACLVLFFALLVFFFWAKQSRTEMAQYDQITHLSRPLDILPDTFSVMTYNLGYGSGMTNNLPEDRPASLFENNMQNAAGLLNIIQPHIIGFQEIDFNSERSYYLNQMIYLAEKASYPFAAAAVNWDKRYVPFPYWPMKYHFGEMLSGQAILSQLEIISNQRMVLPFPDNNPFYYDSFYLDRLAQITWLKNGSDSILLVNVHFEAWDGPTREIQAELVLDIFKEFEDRYAIFLIGDFNCNPPFDSLAMNEKTIETFHRHPSISFAIDEASYRNSPREFFTFDSRNPNIKIDYIMYNNRFVDCIDANVVHEAGNISDHLPVVAWFVFKI